jgi:hypothetical protein
MKSHVWYQDKLIIGEDAGCCVSTLHFNTAPHMGEVAESSIQQRKNNKFGNLLNAAL